MRLILALSFFLLSCKEIPVQEPKPAPPVVAPAPSKLIADWDKEKRGKEWTGMVVRALHELGPSLLKEQDLGDSGEYCPAYPRLSLAQREQFWVMLISSMARFESGFKPETKYTEDFDDAQGKPVISRGLLQISIESANSYGCGFKKAEELHDAERNLRCGIVILDRWVGRDAHIGDFSGLYNSKGHKIFWGGGRYWSVLRPTSGSRAKIIAKVRALEFCK